MALQYREQKPLMEEHGNVPCFLEVMPPEQLGMGQKLLCNIQVLNYWLITFLFKAIF